MKAVVLPHYGPPEVLRVEERPIPEPAAGEVRVRVHASAINDWDWSYVRGQPYVLRLLFGLHAPRASILGAEAAGTVEAVGPDVTRFRPGDRVYGDLSESGFGGFAEYVCAPETALTPMPPGMTFEQAAALPHAAALAHQGLVDVGGIGAGARVLINGAGGGVGSLGLQIAKTYGAEVTGVDHGRKLDALREAGFDHVVDYQATDFTRTGERYDLILDVKTDRSPFAYPRALRPGGRYVTVGGQLPRLLQVAALGPLIGRATGKRVRVLALQPNKDLDRINTLFESHGLSCRIDGVYPLEAVPEALRRFGEARHIGKVVIAVAPPDA